jgi:tRNA pseudouridine(38-40) synthase
MDTNCSNPGFKTIESELERAIVKAGGIDEWNAGSFTKVNWQRCARTDKGVHACLNVVSLKIGAPSVSVKCECGPGGVSGPAIAMR